MSVIGCKITSKGVPEYPKWRYDSSEDKAIKEKC